MKTTFIYALCEPGTRTVRYIGKTNDLARRFKEHLCVSIRARTHLGYWLAQVVARGEVPEMIELRKVPGNGCEAERRYIRLALGCKMNLVNLTEGGDGAGSGEDNHFFGCTHPEETLVKLRGPKTEAHKQKMRSPRSEAGKANMRKPKSAAHRASLSVSSHFSNQGVKKNPRSSSRFLGVGWMPTKRKWRARIKGNRVEVHLGLFSTEIEAAHAYDVAAIKYFGESSRRNFSTT